MPRPSLTPNRSVLTGAECIAVDAADGTIAEHVTIDQIRNGPLPRTGTVTLINGFLVVSDASITYDTRIFLSVRTPGGTQGFLSTQINPGVSFSIVSTSVTETSNVDYLLTEPA